MHKHASFLLGAVVLSAGGLSLHAGEELSAKANPVGTWKWFVGRDVTFHPDGTVTYPGNFALWRWIDEGKRQLRIEWKTFDSTDNLTLSGDGAHLRSEQPVRGLGADGVVGDRVVSPLGVWRMNKGADITFREDHSAAFSGVTSGFWYWTDEPQRQFKVEWTTIPYVDNLTLSEDGHRIAGRNHIADEVSGERIDQAPPDAVAVADATQPTVPSGEAAKPAKATPVGTWSWFVGPDLTFHADGTLTGKNRAAHWKWIDEAARQLTVTWEGVQSGLTDNLTLSADGKHLEGSNGDGITVTGDRMDLPASAVK